MVPAEEKQPFVRDMEWRWFEDDLCERGAGREGFLRK